MHTRDGLELEAHFSADTANLSVHYKVVNKQTKTAYLQNRVHRPDSSGVPQIHKDFAYVYVDERRIVVEKAIPAIPPGLSPNEPVAPYSTPLRPGDSFEETVQLPLPVRDSRPYRGRPPSDQPVTIGEARFVLGYMLAPEGTTERTLAVGQETVVLFQVPAGKLAVAGELAVEMPILSAENGKPASVPALPPKP